MTNRWERLDHWDNREWRRLALLSTLTIVCAAILLLLGPSVPARADGSTQLEPDGQLRYLPVFTDSGETLELANIDSVTSPRLSPDGTRVAFSG